ncbi:hypothetical protein NQD34_018516 [Periophthalmus magnuspinnatus]|nr:hypothetical protein NQD34_018516 [Periophthalmus magnuspinnatus]
MALGCTILIWTLACCCFTGSTLSDIEHNTLPFLSVFLLINVYCFLQDAVVRSQSLSLQSRRLLQDPQSLSHVKLTQMFIVILMASTCSGISRNLVRLQSSG